MPDLYTDSGEGHNSDGYAAYFAVDAWDAGSRGATAGSQGSNTFTRLATGAAYRYYAARGSTVVMLYRSYFQFDTSGISVAPSAATFKLRGYRYSEADMIAVKAELPFESTAKNNFDHIDGCASQLAASAADGSGTLASCATDYSAEITSWSTSGYNDITLTEDARDDMAANDSFGIMLMEYDHDYLDIAAASANHYRNGLHYTNYSGTSRDPYIDYTAGVAGYGNSVMGVASGNIGKINGIATADISKVTGV